MSPPGSTIPSINREKWTAHPPVLVTSALGVAFYLSIQEKIMAVCNWCKEEMKNSAGCSANTEIEFPDGSILRAIPHDENLCYNCDCGAHPGNYHHPGCDEEVCPKCKGQIISCGCLEE